MQPAKDENWVSGWMRKKIAISQVRTGMFIDSVEGPWLKHSLWKTRFLIKDEETLARVRSCGAGECWIDVAEGADVEPSTPASRSAAPAAPSEPRRVVRKSMADELQNAANVLSERPVGEARFLKGNPDPLSGERNSLERPRRTGRNNSDCVRVVHRRNR